MHFSITSHACICVLKHGCLPVVRDISCEHLSAEDSKFVQQDNSGKTNNILEKGSNYYNILCRIVQRFRIFIEIKYTESVVKIGHE